MPWQILSHQDYLLANLQSQPCNKHLRHRIDFLAQELLLSREELQYIFRRATRGRFVALEGELTTVEAKEVLRILTEEEIKQPAMPKHISKPTVVDTFPEPGEDDIVVKYENPKLKNKPLDKRLKELRKKERNK